MYYNNNLLSKKRKAFTLIELLIVIAIIGILFIVLVSKVDFATDKAKATGVQTDFRSFQVAIESVAKEHAGLATFGWDTGDDNGNRIRDSYDKGDTNQNGKQDSGEVFVGSKTYSETWTNVYTLTNPADADDKSAIAALEEAINKNLDPKLHITIHDDLTITMANGAQDPWDTEYHGYYITNATVDNKDRGAIIMYSNGANQEWGSEHSIAGGIVTVNVPGNNVCGKDDYSIASVYTYVNGYGEIKTTTTGFSVNQGGGQAGTDGIFVPGNGGDSGKTEIQKEPLTTFTSKQWNNYQNISGCYVWTDGTNTYYSYSSNQYVLNGDTWEPKTWNGLTSFQGNQVWTDGINTYYSLGLNQYILNKETNTWEAKVWTGLTDFQGDCVWTDGINIYYSNGNNQCVLNDGIWESTTFGTYKVTGNCVWTDGINIYYSFNNMQFILNDGIWEPKTWNGFTPQNTLGSLIWTDGTNIYYSYSSNASSSDQYILNKETSTWEPKTWNGAPVSSKGVISFNGNCIWTDGVNTYYSSGNKQFILS